MNQEDYDCNGHNRQSIQQSEGEHSIGHDGRIERLSYQIQEAKASLHRYNQNSPLRTHMNRNEADHHISGAGTVPNADVPQQPSSTYLSYARDHNLRQASSGERHQNLRDRSQNLRQISQEDLSKGRESKPSTDLKEVQMGYTEFFSWGNDEKGQLGHGVDQNGAKRTLNLPKSLSFEVLIASVSCGASHSGFVTTDGHIFSFGSNVDGQLGIDDKNLNKSTAPLLVSSMLQSGIYGKQIACGSHHTMVMTDQGSVYTWGRNTQGQCGQDPAISSSFFSPQILNFEASHPVQQVECGDLTSALVTTVGQLYTFGDNSQGQLGLGDGVFKSQLVVDRPTRVQDIFDPVKQVSCGFRHTLVLTVKGQMYGFGSNRRHEMGLGESSDAVTNNFFTPLKLEQLSIHNLVHCSAGGFSAAITELNQLIVWGTGQFGVFSTPQKVCMDGVSFRDIQISKQESSFAAAIDQRGCLYAWGPNFDGQLGHGDFNTRTLPTQVMRLKRKQIKKVALGDRFAIAIGKDVSLADLKRRKAAKAAKKQSNENSYQHIEPATAPRQQYNAADVARSRPAERIDETTPIQGMDCPSHRRQTSMHQRIPSSYSRERVTFQPNHHHSSSQQRSFENISAAKRNEAYQTQKTSVNEETSRPLRATNRTGGGLSMEQRRESESPTPSQQVYSNFAMTTNLQQHNLAIKESTNAAPVCAQRQSHSPLRQRSSEATANNFRSHPIAVGGQELSADRSSVTASAKLQPNLRQSTKRDFSLIKSPEAPLTVSRVNVNHPGGASTGPVTRQRNSPLRNLSQNNNTGGSNIQACSSARKYDDANTKNVERLVNMQLDEKENVIRQQQSTIQQLRVQITNEQRSYQSRNDEVSDKLRNCERERNDLRTRLAAELRGYQTYKEELLIKQRAMENEIAQVRMEAECREGRLHQEAHDRESVTVGSLEDQHRQQLSGLEMQHRNEQSILQEQIRQGLRDTESLRDSLQSEIVNLRSLLDSEKMRTNAVHQDCNNIEGEKRLAQDEVIQRGKEIRDLCEEKEMLMNKVKATEIERDTLQERMQVTVSQMNQDINELQKSIGIQNMRLEECQAREEDLKRQLEHERDMVQNRDRRIDDLQNEVTCLRKQIEDNNYQITQIDASRSDLNTRFEDLRVQCSTLEEKLRQSNHQGQNLDNQLQATRLQLERERQRADANQIDLDAQIASNGALRRDLGEEQRRVSNRESDIRNLELALNQLKESMGQEFANKSRDFENMKRAFEDLQHQYNQTLEALRQRNEELDSVQQMNRELQAHANTLLDKVTYQEQVISDIEEKNKRLTDLLNSHMYDRAQNYKEAVLSKLTEHDRSPHQASNVNWMPDSVTGRFASPFCAMTNPHRSVTPDRPCTRHVDITDPDNEQSSRRLAHLLRKEQGEQEALNKHYVALQQQLNKDKFSKSPIRSHEVDLAASKPGSSLIQGAQQVVSMANIRGPSGSPVRHQPQVIPTSIFANQNRSHSSGNNQYRRQEGSVAKSQTSPLRMSSKSPARASNANLNINNNNNSQSLTIRDRERDAMMTASQNHSKLIGPGTNNLSSSVNMSRGIPNFNTSLPPVPVKQEYSPLRSKTPNADKRQSINQESVQLENQTVSASNISHSVMMTELKNLRGQIANVQRQKSQLEGRLNDYEINKMQ